VNLRYHCVLLLLTQMKGKKEFPPDVPSSGDVLSHLSESGIFLDSLLLNIRDHYICHWNQALMSGWSHIYELKCQLMLDMQTGNCNQY